MSKKVLLISLRLSREKDPDRALGHASILAYLKSQNLQVIEKTWSINLPEFKEMDVVNFVEQHADDNTFIAFGAFVWNEEPLQKIVSEIKDRNIPGKVVIGGPQVSYLLSRSMELESLNTSGILEVLYPHADIFIRGYAELALAKLIQSPDSEIPGVHFKGAVDANSFAEVQLNKLPSPLLQGFIQPRTFLRWETKRGCPNRCAFCQHKSPKAHHYYEFPLERVEAEARWVVDHPEIQDIAIVDPTFNIPKTHYLKLLELLLALGYKGKLSLQCYFALVKDEFLDAVCRLKEQASVVLEFGLQTIHEDEQKVIRRFDKLSTVKRVIQRCVQDKIAIEVSLIYGLPHQTVESFTKSIQFLVDQKVTTICVWPLMLSRGTALYEEKEQYGLKESNEVIPHVIKSDSFSLQDYERMKEIAASMDLYNRLPPDEQVNWDVGAQKTKEALSSREQTWLFFKKHQKLLGDTYLEKRRHQEPVLQQLYDERFGVVPRR